MNPTMNDLSAKIRKPIIDLLNQSLADLIVLQLQSKQAHWNVKGQQFIALHELFDKVAGDASAAVDTVAERITALGGTADGTLKGVAKRSTLAEYSLEITSGRDHVESLAKAIASVGKSTRAAIDQSDDLGDAGTADLFTGLSRELDKNLWFVEAHLQGAN